MKFLSILLALILNGCANHQLPNYDGNSSVLIIPKSNVNSTIEAWASRFSLEITRTLNSDGAYESDEYNKTISVSNDKNTYLLIDDLPNGKYYISGITRHLNSKWASRGVTNKTYTTTYIPFYLTKGKITIIDKLFSVSQNKGANGSLVYINANFIELPKSDKESIINELMSDAKANNWDIYTHVY
ncbi:MAG: hypothetical protein ACJAS1_006664 [Oleiphilaceae bacterium]